MTLALKVQGTGDAVVFLHGTPTVPEILDDIATAVSRSHLALQVALPGYGASDALDGAWEVADIAATIEASLLGAGIRRASLVGFSGGAYHAFAVATRRVIEVQRIISIAGFTTLTSAERASFEATAQLVVSGADWSNVALAAFFSPAWQGRAEAVEIARDCTKATSGANLAAELRALARSEDLTVRVARLDLPIHLRHGTADLAVPVEKSDAIARIGRNASVEHVEGAGHMLPVEDAVATIAAVARALA